MTQRISQQNTTYRGSCFITKRIVLKSSRVSVKTSWRNEEKRGKILENAYSVSTTLEKVLGAHPGKWNISVPGGKESNIWNFLSDRTPALSSSLVDFIILDF